MKPITQTILVGDIPGVPGNCLQAAVASLLDLDLDAVPHFALHEDWLERLVEFGNARGRHVLCRSKPVAFGLAFGPSPRGVQHAVVCLDGEIAWDPHPSREGLSSVSTYVDWSRMDSDGS
jgi:hypothetical protein